MIEENHYSFQNSPYLHFLFFKGTAVISLWRKELLPVRVVSKRPSQLGSGYATAMPVHSKSAGIRSHILRHKHIEALSSGQSCTDKPV